MSLPYISPISEQAVQSDAISLTDMSGQVLIDIRGRNPGGVLQTLKMGDVESVDKGVLARLTPEQFMFLANSDANDAAQWLQTEASDARVTITDVTHGYGHMRLAGEQAQDVLPKICGLDFSDKVFPNQHLAQSSLAKVRTLIIRLDEVNIPAYHLIVSASLAAYVWGVVADAMQEFI